jgi:cobalt-zinc-cadmium efflux system protein
VKNLNASSAQKNTNSRGLLLAFGITATFMIIESVGGIISGSLALLADAGHMLTDTMALLFAWLALQYSYKSASARHTFGWRRLTTLAAFINAIALIGITALIVWEAIQRFLNPQPIAGVTMFYVAIAGLLANIAALWILHRGDEGKNLNVRAASLHVVGDLLGSLGAIAAAIIVLLTGWTPIDPILSALVSCLILHSAWKLLKESLNELTESAPLTLDIVALTRNLMEVVPEVYNVHHVHVWLVGEKSVMTLHVQIMTPGNRDDILARIQQFLITNYNVGHATIQLESVACGDFECYP